MSAMKSSLHMTRYVNFPFSTSLSQRFSHSNRRAIQQLRRWPLRNNHTATHILNYALRDVLGDHIDQKGSLVAPTKLRFDFSHKAQVTPTELAHIEALSQDWVRRNVGVFARELALPVAQKIYSLRAVFGESYPDPVRVVSLEYDVEEIAGDLENPKWRKTSIELCGGTYVTSAPLANWA